MVCPLALLPLPISSVPNAAWCAPALACVVFPLALLSAPGAFLVLADAWCASCSRRSLNTASIASVGGATSAVPSVTMYGRYTLQCGQGSAAVSVSPALSRPAPGTRRASRHAFRHTSSYAHLKQASIRLSSRVDSNVMLAHSGSRPTLSPLISSLMRTTFTGSSSGRFGALYSSCRACLMRRTDCEKRKGVKAASVLGVRYAPGGWSSLSSQYG